MLITHKFSNLLNVDQQSQAPAVLEGNVKLQGPISSNVRERRVVCAMRVKVIGLIKKKWFSIIHSSEKTSSLAV